MSSFPKGETQCGSFNVFLKSSEAHAGHHVLLTCFAFSQVLEPESCDVEKSLGNDSTGPFLLKAWNLIYKKWSCFDLAAKSHKQIQGLNIGL